MNHLIVETQQIGPGRERRQRHRDRLEHLQGRSHLSLARPASPGTTVARQTVRKLFCSYRPNFSRWLEKGVDLIKLFWSKYTPIFF
jgi:hypothetical protein